MQNHLQSDFGTETITNHDTHVIHSEFWETVFALNFEKKSYSTRTVWKTNGIRSEEKIRESYSI